MARLATEGQAPSTLVVACMDSRVDPQLIFDAEPGSMFVVRNVANLVPPYAPDQRYHATSAALELAVRAMGVRHVMVLGHAQCGGCRALIEPPDAPVQDFVLPWMEIAADARDRALATGHHGVELYRTCEHEVIRTSLGNLASFPWIAEAVTAGRLSLHGYWFDLGTGTLMELQGGAFVPVDALG